MRQPKKKPPRLASLLMGEPTRQLLPGGGNRTEALGQHSTQSADTESTPTSTTRQQPKLSNPILNVGENERISAGVLTVTLPALLATGLIRKATHAETGNILLVFDPNLWTEEFRLK